jgi:hypothetical protein
MLAPLRVPVEAGQAADLCLELGLDPLDADAVLPLDLGDSRLELRIRGTSHPAVLVCAAGHCSELVASLPGRPGGLPKDERHDLGGLRYQFGAEVLTLAPKELSAHARALRAEVGRDRNGLVGSCADDLEAVTAVRARRRDGEFRWQTWRAYPRTGEIVVTRTSVRVT